MITNNFIEIGNGVRLEYAHRAGAGRTLVFIHGYGDSWYSFKGVLELLSTEFDVYAPTLAGHGHSSKPLREYSIAAYAHEVLAFMDSQHIEQAVIIGHSMGSFVAQEIALRSPERVQAMVLIASAVTADNLVLRQVYDEVMQLADPVPRVFVREFQGGTCALPMTASMSLDEIVNQSSHLPAQVWQSALRGLIGYRAADYDPANLALIRIPTLVLGGAKDEIFPPDAQSLLASSIPEAKLHLHPLAGHAINWELPEEVVAQMLIILKNVV